MRMLAQAPLWRQRSSTSVPSLMAPTPPARSRASDTSKDMITLDNGSSYIEVEGVKLSDFKIGEKVTVSYTKAGEKMDTTSIKPAT